MKNITVSVDEETHRRARIRAAEMDTSVSALVREYLVDLTDRKDDVPSRASVGESEAERRVRGIREAIAHIHAEHPDFSCADNLPRDELYDRARARAEVRAPADRD